MTHDLGVVEAVGLATVQDGGRRGYAAVGVPVSGALHRERYLVATALVSGSWSGRAPAIEVLAGVLALSFRLDQVLAVVGPAAVRIDARRGAAGTTVRVPAGARVTVDHHGPGPAYVAIAGWLPSLTLGSSATDTFSRLGGAVLTVGMVLDGTADIGAVERIGSFHRMLPAESGPVRVVDAGHGGLESFTARPWQVSTAARSGVRLVGGIGRGTGAAASAPMVRGAIQLTPDGEAIVLGPDGGLTGGYPVVGVVATADLDRMSLLAPGDRIWFQEVDAAAAEAARAEQRTRLAAVIAHPRHIH